MAACEEPVSLLIGTEGAGLYNCITADLEVPPPLKLFFCREQLCRESQGDLSLVFFLLCLVILTWRFRKKLNPAFFFSVFRPVANLKHSAVPQCHFFSE